MVRLSSSINTSSGVRKFIRFLQHLTTFFDDSLTDATIHMFDYTYAPLLTSLPQRIKRTPRNRRRRVQHSNVAYFTYFFWQQRPDCVVHDEPLYAHFLRTHPEDETWRPYRDQVFKEQVNIARDSQMLSEGYFGGAGEESGGTINLVFFWRT